MQKDAIHMDMHYTFFFFTKQNIIHLFILSEWYKPLPSKHAFVMFTK